MAWDVVMCSARCSTVPPWGGDMYITRLRAQPYGLQVGSQASTMSLWA